MALTNLTKVQTVGIGSNIEVVGVVTTGQFKSGTSNLHSTGVELTNLNVSGIATIGGNLSIGGTLTYEDVTNIDSIGIITARAGVNVSGGQLDVGSNIKLGNAGVITATSFSGSGANLTSLPAANLTGTLPAISGANLTSLPAANLTGTLPAISGANLTNLDASDLASGTVPTARLGSGTASSSTFLAGDSTYKTVTGTTINNNADNRVITGSGTANTLEGESTFTHDSTNYDTVISGSANAPMDLIIRNDHNSFTGAGARLTIQSGNEANTGPQEQMIVGSHSWLRQVPKSSGNMTLAKNGTNHTTFAATGDLTIGDGNLVVASGHGIDFSAHSNTGSMTSELLDDYEEGTWLPSFYPQSSAMTHSYNLRTGTYVKIGRVVYWAFRMRLSGLSGQMGQTMGFAGLPYTVDSGQPQFTANLYGESYNGETATGMFYDGGTTRGTLYYHKNDVQNRLYASDLNPTNSYTAGTGFYFAS